MTETIVDWIRLSLIEGVGPKRFFSLCSVFGSPSAALHASFAALSPIVGEAVAQAIASGPDSSLLDRTLAWGICPGNRILCFEDDDYPARLKEIANPPPVLYGIGQTDLLDSTALAVVGSRHPTPQGRINAEQFAHALSDAGITIVSGLAGGIDAAAHKGGLAGIGSTIAVMATGADLIYPPDNKGLAADIAETGLLLTEFPLETVPRPQNFPRRNRLISGLSFGCLVVEATALSGSLITSRYALEQGREVFAIPGSIHSPQSKGCHQLIKQGAKLVDSLVDILEEIRLILPQLSIETTEESIEKPLEETAIDPISTDQTAIIPSPKKDKKRSPIKPAAKSGQTTTTESLTPAATPIASADDPLLSTMGANPIDIDSLSCLASLPISELQVRLLELELSGHIERLLSGHYQRVSG